jgi:DNA repair exonuclease SbcCD ATPase subunit
MERQASGSWEDSWPEAEQALKDAAVRHAALLSKERESRLQAQRRAGTAEKALRALPGAMQRAQTAEAALRELQAQFDAMRGEPSKSSAPPPPPSERAAISEEAAAAAAAAAAEEAAAAVEVESTARCASAQRATLDKTDGPASPAGRCFPPPPSLTPYWMCAAAPNREGAMRAELARMEEECVRTEERRAAENEAHLAAMASVAESHAATVSELKGERAELSVANEALHEELEEMRTALAVAKAEVATLGGSADAAAKRAAAAEASAARATSKEAAMQQLLTQQLMRQATSLSAIATHLRPLGRGAAA